KRQQGDVIINMETDMPYNGRAVLSIKGEGQNFTVKIRVPSWVSSPVCFNLNGAAINEGKKNSYISIEREWQNDTVTFELPFSFRTSHYEGAEQVEGYSRWAVEYGPLLMAFKGSLDENKRIKIKNDINKLNEWLIPTEEPLIFNIKNHPDITLEPYFSIPSEEPFTCYPLFR
ncbi:MAG: putative glycosyl hydrolase, partial [Clostridia bacterium]|nr:putative glycosyl hydrolase [Clostridia bacterium]